MLCPQSTAPTLVAHACCCCPCAGTKLSSGQHVHGALITTGLYSLLASLVGFWAALRDSLRWTTVFFLTQVINTSFALCILLVTAVAGQISAPTLGAELPMVCANIYFAVVVNSYRLTLRERLHGASGASSSSSASSSGGDGGSSALAAASGGSIDVGTLSGGSDGGAAAVPSSTGTGGALTGSKIAPYRDAAGGRRGVQLGDGFDDDDDDLALTVQDVQLSVGAARPAAGGGAPGPAAAAAGGRARPGAAAAVSLSLDDGLDEDDNDLGRGGTVGRRV